MSLLDEAHRIALAAGRSVMDVYENPAWAKGVTAKADDSPLTEADRRAHELIVRALTDLTPRIPVLSEEGSHRLPPSEAIWVVDPVDGTKEFLKRSGEFTINIALVREGRPVLGVVVAPALDRAWLGEEGGDAYTTTGGARVPIGVRRLAEGPLRLVASKDHAGPQVRALLSRFPDATTLSMGSSLKFCLVAEGRADLYLRDGPTMEWDTAAAHAVLRAAGGEVYGVDGVPLSYGKEDFRNGHFVAVGDLGLNWRALVG